MIYYRLRLVDNRNGDATSCTVACKEDGGAWYNVGRTAYYRPWPRMVRARRAGETLALKHARRNAFARANLVIISQ